MPAFAQHDVMPGIPLRAPRSLDRLDARAAFVELDTGQHVAKLILRRLAEQAHGVFALYDRLRPHETVSELTIGREDQ